MADGQWRVNYIDCDTWRPDRIRGTACALKRAGIGPVIPGGTPLARRLSCALGVVGRVPGDWLRVVRATPGSGPGLVSRLIAVWEMSGLAGLLVIHAPALWIASRAATDLMDIALLLRSRPGAARGSRLTVITVAVAGALGVSTACAPDREFRVRA
jgi:hypothetical protein